MYLLGHVAIGYILAGVVARGRKQTLILWAVFTASILPDYDILFLRFGLVHDTYTHSLVILAPLALVLVVWKRESLPYVTALLSHIAVDMLMGTVRIFRPISSVTFSLNLRMGSNIDAVIEIGALALMMTLMWRNNDLNRLLRGGRQNLLMVFPLVTVSGSALLAASRIGVWRGWGIVSYGSSATVLEIITLGHVILVTLMTLSVLMAIISTRSLLDS